MAAITTDEDGTSKWPALIGDPAVGTLDAFSKVICAWNGKGVSLLREGTNADRHRLVNAQLRKAATPGA